MPYLPPLNVTEPQRTPAGFAILAAAAPRLPTWAGMAEPGLSLWLTHDEGMQWPDRRSAQFMNALLEQGGTVALIFASAEDAACCLERLTGGQA